jgi:hypothetical protein
MAGYPHLQMEWTTTIANSVQLQLMAVKLNATYTLANSFDATETQNWNWVSGTTYEGFMPIGNITNKFTGTFVGGGKIISNLYINRATAIVNDYIGLFGYLDDPSIVSNLGLASVYVKGDYFVGALAGHNYKADVSYCYSTGEVIGTGESIGGLLGCNEGGTVSYS